MLPNKLISLNALPYVEYYTYVCLMYVLLLKTYYKVPPGLGIFGRGSVVFVAQNGR